jgi:hypothetical protein
MHNPKRLIVATVSGLIFGFAGLVFGGPVTPPWPIAAQIIISRMLIGVAIGISSIALGHWSIHGLVMGLLFSLPLAFGGLMAPDNPDVSKSAMFVSTVVLGMFFGLLIELITTVLFKARQHS